MDENSPEVIASYEEIGDLLIAHDYPEIALEFYKAIFNQSKVRKVA